MATSAAPNPATTRPPQGDSPLVRVSRKLGQARLHALVSELADALEQEADEPVVVRVDRRLRDGRCEVVKVVVTAPRVIPS